MMNKSGDSKPFWQKKTRRRLDTWPATPQAPAGNLPFDNAGWRTQWPYIQKHCNGCGLCNLYCPDAAITGAWSSIPRVDKRWCKGCGICARECLKQAIIMIDERNRAEDPR